MSIWLTVKLNVTLNRVLDVFERFIHIRPLRMASGKFRTTNGNTFIVCQQRDMKFPLHRQKNVSTDAAHSQYEAS